MNQPQPTRCEKCGKKKVRRVLLKPCATYNSYCRAPAQEPRKRHRPEGRLMEFVRKKKRGQNQKVRRTWFSEEGYRIVWRKEVYGVRVPARFQACVRTLIPYSGGELRQMWDFVNHKRRLIKTLRPRRKSARNTSASGRRRARPEASGP